MPKIVWDKIGEREYEIGVRNGVMYPQKSDGSYSPGSAWNGLTTVTESPSGAEATALYADNIKYLSLMSAEEFKCTIEAYTYPKEFEACDGSAEIATGVSIGQQVRVPFGLVYTTVKGNDTQNEGYGYKIHIVYGCLAAPSEKAYGTINDSPSAITFSWSVTATPVNVSSVGGKMFKPTATLVIDSTKVDPVKLQALETKLYGGEGEEAVPTLPSPDEVIQILNA